MRQYLSWRFWLNLYIQHEFLRALEQATRDFVPKQALASLRKSIHHHQQQLYNANAWRIQHPPDWFNLEWTVLVLAAYRALQPWYRTPEQATQAIGASFAAPFRKFSKLALIVRYGISPLHPEQAFSVVGPRFIPKGEQFFGRSFVYRQDLLSDKQSFVSIHKCFFNDFFVGNGAPELTRLFCHVDTLFVEELNQPQYRMRFERPTAMGYGDDQCRFQFTKTTTEE